MVTKKQFGIEDFLAHLPLFRGVEKTALKHIARGTTAVDAPRGTVLFRRGDRCSGFHVVIFGQVKLSLCSPQGSEKVIELMGPGQSFGEGVMFLDQPHLVMAETLADTKLVLVSRQAVQAELDRDPGFSRRIIAGLSRRLHRFIADLEDVTQHSGTQRVIRFLLNESALDDTNSPFVTLHANKRVIASRLNLSQEHFSRILHELAAAGLVDVRGRVIRILDPERLRDGEKRYS